MRKITDLKFLWIAATTGALACGNGTTSPDMAAAGARFGVMDRFLSYYRMHPTSITASQKMAEAGKFERKRLFEKVFGRRWRSSDVCALFASRVLRHLRNPKGFFERAFYGRTYGRVD